MLAWAAVKLGAMFSWCRRDGRRDGGWEKRGQVTRMAGQMGVALRYLSKEGGGRATEATNATEEAGLRGGKREGRREGQGCGYVVGAGVKTGVT